MANSLARNKLRPASTNQFSSRLLGETGGTAVPPETESVEGPASFEFPDLKSVHFPSALGMVDGTSLDPGDLLSRLASHAHHGVTAASHRHTVACMVTHGMGQQVPFETCASIAELFAGSARRPTRIEANRVQLTPGAELLTRMELDFDEDLKSKLPATTLHIYEGYWAPLTEGKISFTKTMTFCISAGVQAFWFSRNRTHSVSSQRGRGMENHDIKGNFFTRWVFGGVMPFPVKPRAYLMIFALILLLAFIILLVVFAQYEFKNVYTAAAAAWKANGTSLQQVWHPLGYLLAPGHILKAVLSLVALVFLSTAAYWIRYFIIEFLGDVVIYVASYKVSEFQEIRNAIQKTVFEVGKQIVAATEPPTPLDAKRGPNERLVYDKLIFVGHSLGSVVTYDLINALIVWDRTSCDGHHSFVDRIERLITFGSPLDKTAFLFRLQTSSDHHYREVMAGLMQPMIVDYKLRPFAWVNLFSHLDPVSGSLAYYDLPETEKLPDGSDRVVDLPSGARRIINQPDPACTVFGRAHLQYWTGDLLRQHLIAALDMQLPPGSRPGPIPTRSSNAQSLFGAPTS